jgi:hypothetical protein
MSPQSDGGQISSTVPALSQRRASYLVRMIKPNLITSHDWHVQPICQRSLWAIRLSGALLDRGPSCYAGVSSNLLRTSISAFFRIRRCFCANLLNLSNFHLSVKLYYFLRLRPHKLVVGGCSSIAITSCRKRKFRSETSHCAQNLSKNGQQSSLEPLGLTGDNLLGRAMACSLRDSQQGLKGYASLHLAQQTCFPLPSSGRPHGHREAPLLNLQLPKSSTRHPLLQTLRIAADATC